MNRLLQHFVDSGGSQGAPPSRPPIPAPPQSSGGSYRGGTRGSYQRAAPGGPFYYQPPPHPQTPDWQQGHSGMDEIPLTSQSTGVMYETVDLNADCSHQQRPSQQRQFTPPPGQSFGYKAEGQQLYQQKPPGSTGSASELFANGPPPARELFGGPPSSGSGGNPYRRQAKPIASGNVAMFGNATPQKDPFATQNGTTMGGHNAPQKDPFAANGGNVDTSPPKDPFGRQNGDIFGQPPQKDPFMRSEENSNVFGNGTPAGSGVHDHFAAKDAGLHQGQQQHPATDPFASTPSQSGSSPFHSPAPLNGQVMASADSLFSSPVPTNNGDWSHTPPPAQSSQPPPTPAQANELFSSDAPSASSLFGGDAPSPFQMAHSTPQTNAAPQVSVPLSPVKPQSSVPPSPAKSLVNIPPSPMKPPIAALPSPMINGSSPPMRAQVPVPASPVMRPEDHFTPAFGSMKLSTPTKSPLKSGLDVRHMKFPTGKRDDDAMSNAPSIAPSRMSMLSTLDDSLKLSDMYKQMTARLEGEKHDLLKVVASQAQEMAQMKKHIKSLELQLKKYQAQDA